MGKDKDKEKKPKRVKDGQRFRTLDGFRDLSKDWEKEAGFDLREGDYMNEVSRTMLCALASCGFSATVTRVNMAKILEGFKVTEFTPHDLAAHNRLIQPIKSSIRPSPPRNSAARQAQANNSRAAAAATSQKPASTNSNSSNGHGNGMVKLEQAPDPFRAPNSPLSKSSIIGSYKPSSAVAPKAPTPAAPVTTATLSQVAARAPSSVASAVAAASQASQAGSQAGSNRSSLSHSNSMPQLHLHQHLHQQQQESQSAYTVTPSSSFEASSFQQAAPPPPPPPPPPQQQLFSFTSSAQLQQSQTQQQQQQQQSPVVFPAPAIPSPIPQQQPQQPAYSPANSAGGVAVGFGGTPTLTPSLSSSQLASMESKYPPPPSLPGLPIGSFPKLPGLQHSSTITYRRVRRPCGPETQYLAGFLAALGPKYESYQAALTVQGLGPDFLTADILCFSDSDLKEGLLLAFEGAGEKKAPAFTLLASFVQARKTWDEMGRPVEGPFDGDLGWKGGRLPMYKLAAKCEKEQYYRYCEIGGQAWYDSILNGTHEIWAYNQIMGLPQPSA